MAYLITGAKRKMVKPLEELLSFAQLTHAGVNKGGELVSVIGVKPIDPQDAGRVKDLLEKEGIGFHEVVKPAAFQIKTVSMMDFLKKSGLQLRFISPSPTKPPSKDALSEWREVLETAIYAISRANQAIYARVIGNDLLVSLSKEVLLQEVRSVRDALHADLSSACRENLMQEKALLPVFTDAGDYEDLKPGKQYFSTITVGWSTTIPAQDLDPVKIRNLHRQALQMQNAQVESEVAQARKLAAAQAAQAEANQMWQQARSEASERAATALEQIVGKVTGKQITLDSNAVGNDGFTFPLAEYHEGQILENILREQGILCFYDEGVMRVQAAKKTIVLEGKMITLPTNQEIEALTGKLNQVLAELDKPGKAGTIEPGSIGKSVPGRDGK